MNQPVKLLSPPILVDSTRFSLYAITEVSRKPKHTHFKPSLQNIHFCARFSHDHVTRRRVQRSFHYSSRGNTTPRRILAFTPMERSNLKRVPRGHPMCSFFLPLFILLEFEHLQCMLTIGYSLLLMRFNLLEGILCPIQIIIETHPCLLESIPL